ncbi:CAP domain-containing protein [Cellulophaga baltica]|uniref:CAP domain-containing protein n=1 Tax=Cellulophaga TaxID=104264 RepID=UPI001C076BFB|nr:MULTISPECIES: CAP domain-containing protein [Cellulophaga]MBU2995723.1 CAP domain-containing protein [Cellulophaga baltica]MDO6767117.1 CAP domain-containing protein [Cellulophaga sp. 1_MG-2023]
MKMRMHYALLVLFVLIISSCGKEGIEDTVIIESENAITVEEELLIIINQHRSDEGFDTLSYSDIAYKYANEHTDYMIAMGDINHDNFSSRASNVSNEDNALAVSENVAKNYETAKIAFERWYSSEEHRNAIDGDFTHTAVSVKKDELGKLYFTQIFYKK